MDADKILLLQHSLDNNNLYGEENDFLWRHVP